MQYAINKDETDMYKHFLDKPVIVQTKDGNYVNGILRLYQESKHLFLESTGCTVMMNDVPIQILGNFHFTLDESKVASITSVNTSQEKVRFRDRRGNLPPLIEKNPPFSFNPNQGYKKIYEEGPEPIENPKIAINDSDDDSSEL